MSDTYIFKRVEKKYRLNEESYARLADRIMPYFVPDNHGRCTICSLYLDTDSFLLIRNSIDATVYKEKLRLRSYGLPNENSKVFIELKKKFKGVVYKRRVSMSCTEAFNYLESAKPPIASQIMDEIHYTMKRYGMPKPSTAIFYEREAFYCRDDKNLRITFDRNIRYRRDGFKNPADTGGKPILPSDSVILEIKCAGGIPLWLANALDFEKIYPTPFSKYAHAYRDFISASSHTNKGDSIYV